MLNQRKLSLPPSPEIKHYRTVTMLGKTTDLEGTIENLQKLLEVSRIREKKLVSKLESMGCSTTLDIEIGTNIMVDAEGCPLEPSVPFYMSFIDRGAWLVGLLIVQSLSSFILSSNEKLLQDHPSIIYFLTMLVGAGGNAGNQAAVRVIRGIALGAINSKNFKYFFIRECMMAVSLSIALSSIGLIRAIISPNITTMETFAISASLWTIVFISIICGSLLPFLLQLVKLDPAHSSTTIQVVMDISGVLITCVISHMILNTRIGTTLIPQGNHHTIS